MERVRLESVPGDRQALRLGAGDLTNRVWEWVAVSKAVFEAHQRSLEAKSHRPEQAVPPIDPPG